MRFPHFRRLPVAVLMACMIPIAAAFAQDAKTTWVDPVEAPAEILPLASQSLLLDIVRSGDRYVAVGARGDVLLSADGKDWQQAQVPTRTTFTAVCAVDAQLWAVGHDGVIAHSADGGDHWQLQRKDPWQAPADGSDATHDPRQGAPLLGVLFTDSKHGYAIGAYSLALRSDDGGATWLPMTVAAPVKPDAAGDDDANADDDKGTHAQTFSKSELKTAQEPTPHLNAIAHTGSGALFIVGERGSAFRSRDQGATWQRLQLPYDGSMFGVIGYEGDHVLAFGLRGHVYESDDLGEHWTQVQTDTELSLMGGTGLANDGAIIVGANGIVLMRDKAGEPLKSYVDQPAGIIDAVLPLGTSGSLLVAGENGISTYQPQ